MLPFILLQSTDIGTGQELWKAIVITLFILSMINERITNFIKLNIESLLSRLLGSPQNYNKLFNDRTNFSVPEKDKDCEKKRERGILNFAIICGFFVATLCGADLLFLVQTGGLMSVPNLSKFLDIREIPGPFIRHGLGFLFTAFFISLGSKFWHDLLDVILYTSNLKRKLAEQDPVVFSSETADEVKEAAELNDRQLADMAHKQFIASLPGQVLPANVVYVGRGRKVIRGRLQTVVIFYLLDANRTTVPSLIRTELNSGRKVDVATYTVINVDAIPRIHFDPGLTIQNGRGSICCLLGHIDKPDSLYALTCSHVLTDGSMIDKGGDMSGSMTETIRVCRRVNGQWIYGLRDTEFDIALIEADTARLTHEYTFVPTLNRFPASTAFEKRRVMLHSQQSEPAEGFILAVNESVDMQYTDETPMLHNLLEIGNTTDDQSSQAISIGGDSGALLYDADTNEPIGMVVGGNARFTYAIPLSTILQRPDLADYQIFSPL